ARPDPARRTRRSERRLGARTRAGQGLDAQDPRAARPRPRPRGLAARPPPPPHRQPHRRAAQLAHHPPPTRLPPARCLMAYIPVDAVEVRAWGQPVGAVALDPATGYYAFEYYPGYGVDLAPGVMAPGGGPYVF